MSCPGTFVPDLEHPGLRLSDTLESDVLGRSKSVNLGRLLRLAGESHF